MFVETVEIGKTLWENRSTLLDVWFKALKKVGFERKIYVCGAGGTGKSSAGEFLKTGKVDQRRIYYASGITEKYDFRNDPHSSIYVVPGQKEDHEGEWDDMFQKITQGKVRGVVNVVSYGYHVKRVTSYADTSAYKELRNERGTEGETTVEIPTSLFIARYNRKNRKRERDLLRELIPYFRAARQKPWLVTLVTKQDLWWNERQEVRYHYEGEKDASNEKEKDRKEQDKEERYREVIDEFRREIGPDFRHIYASVSFVIQNFWLGERSPLLALNCEGYDQGLQFANQNDFVWRLSQMTTGR